MSDYAQSGNRYTAIFIEDEHGLYKRAPFDIVRFNVDIDRNPRREIVPRGNDDGKIFERIWVAKDMPWQKKVSFNG